jgi:hypothetical protein
MYKERLGDPAFERRDKEYRAFQAYYLGRGESGEGYDNPLGKPLLRDVVTRADGLVINIAAQVINHFSAMFAKMPNVRALPASPEPDQLALANKKTGYIRFVFNRSSMKAQQPLQSHRFALKGDALYGVDWDTAKGDIWVRTFDPSWAYPRFNELDMGALDDLLLTYKVHRRWVEEQMHFSPEGTDKMVDMFIYWDSQDRIVEVGERRIEAMTVSHELGFVPFRWAFSRPTFEFAMSDIRDILPLQDAYNEVTVLMMDALRKTIEPAYWGVGFNQVIKPKAGEAIGFADPQARIERFPMADPPAVALQVLGQVMQDVGRVAGISPISLEGVSSNSIVTGTAVRNQVEAIEARSATKRAVLEAAFGRLGEYILRILEAKFPSTPLAYQHQGGKDQITGGEVQGWYECEADYGEMFGMDMARRTQVALQGLGRIWDDRFAVETIIQPGDIEAQDMLKRLAEYQVRQATVTALAQAAAQETAQAGQPGGLGGGAGQVQGQPPQPFQHPPQPSAQQLMAASPNGKPRQQVV